MPLSTDRPWDSSSWKIVFKVGTNRLWFTYANLEAELSATKIRTTLAEMQRKGFVLKGGTDSHRRSLFRLTDTDRLRACLKSGVCPPDQPAPTPGRAPPTVGSANQEYVWKPVLRPGALDAFRIPSRGIDDEPRPV